MIKIKLIFKQTLWRPGHARLALVGQIPTPSGRSLRSGQARVPPSAVALTRTYGKIAMTLMSLLLGSCSDSITDRPLDNQPPTVSVFLQSDGALNRTSSNQLLFWSGKDIDGLVVGYYYTFGNSSNRDAWEFLADSIPVGPELDRDGIPFWRFTTERSDTFSLAIFQDTITYIFSIMALDDEGALSAEPTRLTLPIENSKPEVFFVGEVDTASSSVKIPDTTFTVASFSWGASDVDGEETIGKFQYAITSPGDSIADALWVDIPAKNRSIVISGTVFETEEEVFFDDRLIEGDHAFYLRAIDVAGALSKVKRLPEDEEDFWYVMEPEREILIIDDWEIPSTEGRNFYTQSFDSFGRKYSILDIKPEDGKFLYSKIAFAETVKLFKVALWYADGTPNLELADAVVSKFIEQGGKVIFSTLFGQFANNQGDPLGFTPVDSIDVILETDSSLVSKIAKFWKISLWPDPPVADILPDTLGPSFPGSIISSPRTIIPKASARVLYRYQAAPNRYAGEPVVMVEDANKSFVFTSIPLHYFNGNGNMGNFIELILTQEFGL